MKSISIKIALLVALLFFQKLENAAASPPNWTVNPANFQFNMNLLVRLRANGALNNASQNLVGAFVGGELRGVAQPILAGGSAYFFITVYSNSYAGELLNFRIFVAADDKIYNAGESQVFKHNGQAGKFDQPFLVNVCRDYSTSHSTINPTCFGNSNGTIFTSVAGFSPAYTYLWSNGKTTRDINLLAAGSYTLTVTDAGGCTTSKTTVLTQPTTINFAVNFTANLPGFDAIFTTSGGSPGYLYNRTGMAAADFRAASDPIFDHLAANTSFIFKVKDANGCQKSVIKKTPVAMLDGGGTHNDGASAAGERSRSVGFDDESEADFVVFPNPAQEVLNVQFLEESEIVGTLTATDLLGKIVFFQKIKLAGEPVLQVPTGHLPAGGYVLVFRGESGFSTVSRFFVGR